MDHRECVDVSDHKKKYFTSAVGHPNHNLVTVPTELLGNGINK
jgi:hypothetical protein